MIGNVYYVLYFTTKQRELQFVKSYIRLVVVVRYPETLVIGADNDAGRIHIGGKLLCYIHAYIIHKRIIKQSNGKRNGAF